MLFCVHDILSFMPRPTPDEFGRGTGCVVDAAPRRTQADHSLPLSFVEITRKLSCSAPHLLP